MSEVIRADRIGGQALFNHLFAGPVISDSALSNLAKLRLDRSPANFQKFDLINSGKSAVLCGLSDLITSNGGLSVVFEDKKVYTPAEREEIVYEIACAGLSYLPTPNTPDGMGRFQLAENLLTHALDWEMKNTLKNASFEPAYGSVLAQAVVDMGFTDGRVHDYLSQVESIGKKVAVNLAATKQQSISTLGKVEEKLHNTFLASVCISALTTDNPKGAAILQAAFVPTEFNSTLFDMGDFRSFFINSLIGIKNLPNFNDQEKKVFYRNLNEQFEMFVDYAITRGATYTDWGKRFKELDSLIGLIIEDDPLNKNHSDQMILVGKMLAKPLKNSRESEPHNHQIEKFETALNAIVSYAQHGNRKNIAYIEQFLGH